MNRNRGVMNRNRLNPYTATPSAPKSHRANEEEEQQQQHEIVPPDSPDCGLPEWHPARDGKRTSVRIAAYSPEKGFSAKTEPVD